MTVNYPRPIRAWPTVPSHCEHGQGSQARQRPAVGVGPIRGYMSSDIQGNDHGSVAQPRHTSAPLDSGFAAPSPRSRAVRSRLASPPLGAPGSDTGDFDRDGRSSIQLGSVPSRVRRTPYEDELTVLGSRSSHSRLAHPSRPSTASTHPVHQSGQSGLEIALWLPRSDCSALGGWL
jgi:hypothetical protein